MAKTAPGHSQAVADTEIRIAPSFEPTGELFQVERCYARLPEDNLEGVGLGEGIWLWYPDRVRTYCLSAFAH